MAKITRATGTIFGSTASASQIAKFGSLAASSPVTYSGSAALTNVVTIQSLGNWASGWFSGVETGNSPAIEDMNAFCFVNSYQVNYLLQEGVAEWDAGTTYYIGSIANSSGVLYSSLTNSNLNNLVTDTSNWTPILFAGGSTALPGVAFSGNVNTGMSNPSGNVIAFSTNGTQRLQIDTSKIIAALPYQASDGAVGAPGFAIGSLTDGIYKHGAHEIGFSTNGIAAGYVDASQNWFFPVGVTVTGTTTLATALSGVVHASAGVLTASSIVNADVSSSAAIVVTKLANGTANQIVGTNTGATANEFRTVATGTTGSDFAVAFGSGTMTFNLPDAGASARGAVTTGTQTFAGAKTLSSAVTLTGGINGVTDASSAGAGIVGEIIAGQQTSLQNAPTSTQYGDITSVTLTAGAWLISVNSEAVLNTGTGVTDVSMGIGTTTGNSSAGIISGVTFHTVPPPTSNYNAPLTIASYPVNISGSTTYYLKMNATYSGGTPQFRGRIQGQRIR